MNINDIKKNMLKYEDNLSPYASKDKEAIRLTKSSNKEDIRPNYLRDIDKILFSLSYTRYIDKTQVFSKYTNDHTSTRIMHVQLVSKIARTIGRALSLNEDLIEAISLGHDIGHVPYGHVGESILNKLSLKYDNTYFMHNVQSVRNLMTITNKNLTIQVLDGILAHNGEMLTNIYHYKHKTKEEFLEEYEKCYTNKNYSTKIIPMTLEGCVVKISDIIGYIGRDLEDAMRLGIIKLEDIPQNIKDNLGSSNGEIINTLTMDLIKNSLGKDYLKLSNNIFSTLQELIKFNYEHIYLPANSKEDLEEYDKKFTELFIYYKDNIDNKEISLYKDFLCYQKEDYLAKTSSARKVIDFIAGMTDRYFNNEYAKYIELNK